MSVSENHNTAEDTAEERDDTTCAEHRKIPGEAHEWRRGRRGHTRLVVCNGGGHRHDHPLKDVCTPNCHSYDGMLMEKTTARLSTTRIQNNRGEWVPAIPLPYYLSFGRRKCGHQVRRQGVVIDTCNKITLGDKRYREHYALVHVLGLD